VVVRIRYHLFVAEADLRGPGALEKTVGHPSPARSKLARWRVVGGVLVAPLAFAAQILISYAVAAQGCGTGRLPSVALTITNLAALALLLCGLLLSWRNHRALRGEEGGSTSELHDRGDGRTRFLIQFGLWMSLLFAIAGLIEFLAILMLGTCVGYAPTV
jgi:hypothetical protein